MIVNAEAVDDGNDPTTTLRAGLAIGLKTSDGEAYAYDADAADGTQFCIGALYADTPQGEAALVVTHGNFAAAELIGFDAAALAQCPGLVVDYIPQFGGLLMQPRGVQVHATNYNVQAADNGLLLLATAAATFTLPSPANGLAFRFAQSANANLVIAGSSNLICGGVNDGSSAAFTTTDEKAGAHALVEAVYVAGGTLKWLVSNLSGLTMAVS